MTRQKGRRRLQVEIPPPAMTSPWGKNLEARRRIMRPLEPGEFD